MAEVKLLAPVQATKDAKLCKAEWEGGTKFAPGAFCISGLERGGVRRLWYCCPCGCGSIGGLPARLANEPDIPPPRWLWDGNTDEPTLAPSIHQIGHWHGYLRKGMFTDA